MVYHDSKRGINEIDLIIAKTMQYLDVPAVVGHEGIFMAHLQADFQKLRMNTVRYDGVLEITGNDPKSAIICAHIDRHGLISLGDREYAYAGQYIKEIKYGEHNVASINTLKNIADRFDGERVYAYDAQTGEVMGRGIIRTAHSMMHDGDSVFFVEGMGDIPQNTPLAYGRTAVSQDGKFKGQIDNALSLGVVYALFQSGFQGTALLTCEEEIGKSWIHIAKYLTDNAIETQNLLVLDTSPYMDNGAIDDGMLVLRRRDKSERFNGALVDKLIARCDALSYAHQVKDEFLLERGRTIKQLGSTELGRLISETQGRWSGATVQVPTNMYHTSSETTTKKAIRTYYRFLKNILIDDAISLGFD